MCVSYVFHNKRLWLEISMCRKYCGPLCSMRGLKIRIVYKSINIDIRMQMINIIKLLLVGHDFDIILILH